MSKQYTEQEKAEILQWAADNTIREACEKFGVSKYAINEWKGWKRKNKKEAHDRWLAKHGEKYHKNPTVRKRKNEVARIWREKNPEKVKNSLSKYRKTKRFTILASYANRNCKQKNLKDFYVLQPFDLWKIAKRQKLVCPLSGIKLTAKNLSVDHIIPLSKGGSNAPENIRLVDKWVNLMILDRTDEEFINMCKRIVEFNT